MERYPFLLRSRILHRLIGMVQLTRPWVGVVAALYTLLGVYLGGNVRDLLSPTALRAGLVVGLVASFSFALNDYRDAISDSLNHPNRPIPSEQVSPRLASFLSLALALIAIGVVSTLGFLLIAIALFNIILSTLYSYYLKSTVLIGNSVIAFLNASILVYGGLAVGNLTPAIWILSLLAFLFSLAQEILLAVADQDGDAMVGICTTATYLGTRTALRLFQSFALSIVVVTIVVWFLGLAPSRFLYAMILCSILPLVGIVILLGKAATPSNIRLGIRVIILIRFFCLVPGVLLK